MPTYISGKQRINQVFRQNAKVRYVILILLGGLIPLSNAFAQSTELESVNFTIVQFIREQTRNQPHQIDITVGKFSLQRLAGCENFQAFAPSGTRLAGTTHIGLRCLSPRPGSILVPVQIAVTGNYLTTTRSLPAGTTLQPSDLSLSKGDLSTLPSGIVTSPEQAIGKTLKNAVAIGLPLRGEQLMAQWVIRQGQTIRIVSKGEGFSISSEGMALANASAGESVRAKMLNGQIVSGRAMPDGSIEIRF